MKTPSNNPNLLQLLSWISNFGSFTAAAISVLIVCSTEATFTMEGDPTISQSLRQCGKHLVWSERVPTSFTWNITEYLHIHVCLCTDLWLNSDMLRKIYTNQVSSPIFLSWNVICSLNHTGFGSSHTPSVHPLPSRSHLSSATDLSPLQHL